MQPHLRDQLIPPHGGYRNLKSFQVAQLTYDVTVRFCELYIDKRSRTHDQMVQAARSGVQNIAEGSQASGTSKKTEIKLTNVARASLEELRLDYEDYLRQRSLAQLPPTHPSSSKPSALHLRQPNLRPTAPSSLLNLACHLLDKQLAAQERAFLEKGGFTERLYHARSQHRNRSQNPQ